MRKHELRSQYQRLRNSLTPTFIRQGSQAIANHCLNLPIWDARLYHIFLTAEAKKEVDTQFLIAALRQRKKELAVPKVRPGGQLDHYLFQEETPLVPGAFGIPEPDTGQLVPPNLPDVIFLPLLAFDLQGNRVGYGGGYYDRFLSQRKQSAILVGLSLLGPAAQISDVSEWDVSMDYAVTPEGTYAF